MLGQSGPATRARKLSDIICDIFRRMLIMSHPEVARKRPGPSSSVCGETGYTARSTQHKFICYLLLLLFIS